MKISMLSPKALCPNKKHPAKLPDACHSIFCEAVLDLFCTYIQRYQDLTVRVHRDL